MELSKEDFTALAAVGIAIFHNRVIYNAQPPLDEAVMAQVAEVCSGPLPEEIVQLWRTTAGGRIDYEMHANFDGYILPCEPRELFYPGSDTYRDLWGWIEHELEIAEEKAEEKGIAFTGKLDYLPFGGFEYLYRFYIVVRPGEEYGSVVVWRHGLPPGWGEHEGCDRIATVSTNLEGFFAQMYLPAKPDSSNAMDDSGYELLQELDALHARDAIDKRQMAAVAQIHRQATIPWKELPASS
jgi:hypothetical protein